MVFVQPEWEVDELLVIFLAMNFLDANHGFPLSTGCAKVLVYCELAL
jgi:hypothetical protein